jgi:integrase/recombinase XerC
MLQEFENWLRFEKRYSNHTIISYLNDLKQFIEYLDSNYNQNTLDDASSSMIKSWIVKLMENKFSPTTINRKIVSINAYFKFLIKEGKIEKSPARQINGPKKAKRLVKYLEESEMIGVLENVEFEETFTGIRDKLILELLYGTGIRLSELIGLTLVNLDLNSNTIKVLGKRNKERIIPLNHSLKELLIKYLNYRKSEFALVEIENVLLTNQGKELYPMFVYRTVKNYIEIFSTRTKVSPHTLRHSFATHLLNRGADINAIKELLGHSNLAATQVYTHNSIETLKKVYKQAHPRG